MYQCECCKKTYDTHLKICEYCGSDIPEVKIDKITGVIADPTEDKKLLDFLKPLVSIYLEPPKSKLRSEKRPL